MTLVELKAELSSLGFKMYIVKRFDAISNTYGIIKLIPLISDKYKKINDIRLHYVNSPNVKITAYMAHTNNGVIITGTTLNNLIKNIKKYTN